jgi:hypothetical protein
VNNPALAGAETIDSSGDWRNRTLTASWAKCGAAPYARWDVKSPQKACKLAQDVELIEVDRQRSSGRLLRSKGGVSQSGIWSMQRGGSSRSMGNPGGSAHVQACVTAASLGRIPRSAPTAPVLAPGRHRPDLSTGW